MTAPHPLIEELQQAREAAGLSIREAERNAHLGLKTISEWERGGGVQLANLEQYAASLGYRLALVPVADDLTKWCPGCRSTLRVTAFHRDRSRPDGREYRCKVCRTSQKGQAGEAAA
jgi:transcriptional regulator with XRE-family HTH domain